MAVRNASDPEYSTWVHCIGEGTNVENRSDTKVTLNMIDRVEILGEAIQFLFPAPVLAEYQELSKRSFLSPVNIHVDNFNSMMLTKLQNNDGMYKHM